MLNANGIVVSWVCQNCALFFPDSLHWQTFFLRDTSRCPFSPRPWLAGTSSLLFSLTASSSSSSSPPVFSLGMLRPWPSPVAQLYPVPVVPAVVVHALPVLPFGPEHLLRDGLEHLLHVDVLLCRSFKQLQKSDPLTTTTKKTNIGLSLSLFLSRPVSPFERRRPWRPR